MSKPKGGHLPKRRPRFPRKRGGFRQRKACGRLHRVLVQVAAQLLAEAGRLDRDGNPNA